MAFLSRVFARLLSDQYAIDVGQRPDGLSSETQAVC